MDYTPSTLVKVVLAAMACVIVVVGYVSGQSDGGFLFAVSIPLILLAAWIRRDLARRLTFWVLIAFWAVAHSLFIIWIQPKLALPSISYAPLFIVDYIVVLGSFFLLEKVEL